MKRVLLALLVLGLALVPGADAALHVVRVVETGDGDAWAFSPDKLTAVVGDTIRFIDDAPAGHTVTSDDPAFHKTFNGDKGDRIDVSVDRAGQRLFYCTPHPWMEVRVTVQAASTTPGMSSSTGQVTDGDRSGPAGADPTPWPTMGLIGALALIAARRRR